MLNQISLANTFQHLVTAASGLISLMNLLTDGSVFVANTQLQLTGAGTSLIVNNSILVGNTITVNGSLNLISNSIKTNNGTATVTLPTVSSALIGANDTVTLRNKTLESPNINSPIITTNGGTATIALPTVSATLVGRDTTETLTNKTLVSSNLNNSTLTGTTSVSTLSLTGHALSIDGGAATITFPQNNSDVILAGNLNQVMISKTLENCTLANCFIFTPPLGPLYVPNAQYVTDQIAAALQAQFTTGDVKLTLKTVADTGWVLMNDGSIGNASSAATTRANADTQALFTLIYSNTSDTDCPVSGGRSGNATTDFNANKRLTLPKALGRALAQYGTGAGLNAKRLGQTIGQEDAITVTHNHSTTITQTPHAHGAIVNSLASGGVASINAGGASTDGGAVVNVTSSNANIGVAVSNAGSSGSQMNWQPTLFLNVMIKL